MAPIFVLPKNQQWHRLIPTHYPPINLFESVADPADLDYVFAIEALTNDRLRDEVGMLALVAPEDRICGLGSTPIMAAFTHIGKESRFSDGSYGVYYAADSKSTALAETIYHREKFLAATEEPDTEITMRDYVNRVIQPLHDIRSNRFSALVNPHSYVESQCYAQTLRAQQSHGLIYPSVRNAKGACIAIFKPKALTIPVQGGHYRYVWNGCQQRITEVLAIRKVTR